MSDNFSEKLKWTVMPSYLRYETEGKSPGFYSQDNSFLCSPFYISCVGEIETNPNDLRWCFFLNVLTTDNEWGGDWIPFHYLHYMNKQKIMDRMMDMGVWMEGSVLAVYEILRHQISIVLEKTLTENEGENDEIA